MAIAPDATTFVLAEVGPWQLRDGKTVVTYPASDFVHLDSGRVRSW